MPRRRSPASPWITLAMLAALLTGAGYGWWRSGGGPDAAGPGSTPAGDAAPAPGVDAGQGTGLPGQPGIPAGGGATGPAGEEAALANPLWPLIQPVDLAGGAEVRPRPVAMAAEGYGGVLGITGDRLWFAGPGEGPAEIFRLPPGHRWASPVVPAPDGSAVALLTRAEAGTPYLWVVQSDLTSTPHAVPDDLRRPATVAWAGPGAVVAGDPPYLLDVASGRWSRLPGGALTWSGPPSPGGRYWIYGAATEEGGTGATLYVVDRRRGGVRPLDLGGDPDLAVLPGPWVDEGRFLAALSAGAGSSGGTGAGAAAPVRQVVAVDAGTGRWEAVFDGGGADWNILGASPNGRWVVLAPGADGGAAGSWRLLDTTRGTLHEVAPGWAEPGVAWDARIEWLFYLAPGGSGAVRLEGRRLPAGDGGDGGAGAAALSGLKGAGNGSTDGTGGGAGNGATSEGNTGQMVSPDSWPPVRPAPAGIRRLLAVDLAAAVAWVELNPGGPSAAPVVARWNLAEGRLEPLR
ncbi:hypothetical protein Tmar_0580 [Thermaerobacter marianensis DSM 12885]|uniref:Uncharacterized protein n=1 Tax=Thermaerobacter marianensis (strain ATCC 700841 / DSM 12885 / JCM 10246 / 7p75a) TaxID=644966 RepID=E6SHD7_THEM7|nr:hypothetical protein [Thermaerobacter marianensis]ADU50701.1 hypothetical protein Tmar_0580 [Thermaerobacter marianensis DSM 12885]